MGCALHGTGVILGEQQLLLSVEYILDIHPLHTFKIFFDHLNADDLGSAYLTGRRSFSRW
jgi:hypothetical protein